MTRPKGTCVYCGTFDSLHMDHVPPENLFEPHDKSNLVTVPCCFKCNNSASMDDQYFLVFIGLREDAKQKPEHHKLWQKAHRTLKRRRLPNSAKRSPRKSNSYNRSSQWATYNPHLEKPLAKSSPTIWADRQLGSPVLNAQVRTQLSRLEIFPISRRPAILPGLRDFPANHVSELTSSVRSRRSS